MPAKETPEPETEHNGPELVIITGLSGAGRSEAIHTFEDLGYFCIDNLPPTLIGQVVQLAELPGSRIERVAVVCDMRALAFFDALLDELDRLGREGRPLSGGWPGTLGEARALAAIGSFLREAPWKGRAE